MNKYQRVLASELLGNLEELGKYTGGNCDPCVEDAWLEISVVCQISGVEFQIKHLLNDFRAK